MIWADYLFLGIGLVCLLVLVLCLLGNLACTNLLGAADETPAPTRRADMRLVADQTRSIQKMEPTPAQIKAARQRSEERVRTQAVTAALLDAGSDAPANGRPCPCPYRPGSKAAHLWQTTYDRVRADCSDADEQARA